MWGKFLCFLGIHKWTIREPKGPTSLWQGCERCGHREPYDAFYHDEKGI